MGVHESSLNITFPLLLLAFGSIFVGYLAKEITLSNVIPTNSIQFNKNDSFII